MDNVRKIYCNTCGISTNHRLALSHIRYTDKSHLRHLQYLDEFSLQEPLKLNDNEVAYIYNLWICQGCDTATLQEACTLKSFIKGNNMRAKFLYNFYPPRLENGIYKKPIINLPTPLYSLYNEIINSYNNGLVVLCSIGLRALLEGICVDKGITDSIAWGLEKKIEELGKAKHVPNKIANSLKSFKFIGDDAAHRLKAPKSNDLKLSIEVIEELMIFLYSLDHKADFLLGRVKK